MMVERLSRPKGVGRWSNLPNVGARTGSEAIPRREPETQSRAESYFPDMFVGTTTGQEFGGRREPRAQLPLKREIVLDRDLADDLGIGFSAWDRLSGRKVINQFGRRVAKGLHEAPGDRRSIIANAVENAPRAKSFFGAERPERVWPGGRPPQSTAMKFLRWSKLRRRRSIAVPSPVRQVLENSYGRNPDKFYRALTILCEEHLQALVDCAPPSQALIHEDLFVSAIHALSRDATQQTNWELPLKKVRALFDLELGYHRDMSKEALSLFFRRTLQILYRPYRGESINQPAAFASRSGLILGALASSVADKIWQANLTIRQRRRTASEVCGIATAGVTSILPVGAGALAELVHVIADRAIDAVFAEVHDETFARRLAAGISQAMNNKVINLENRFPRDVVNEALLHASHFANSLQNSIVILSRR